MTEKERIRLDCLKLAEKARASGDTRPLLEIANDYFSWIFEGNADAPIPDANVSEIEPSMLNLFDQPRKPGAPGTIKEMVLAVLKEADPSPLTALEILDRIQRKWMPLLVRTSLSPQLTRLKRAGEILSVRGAWTLTAKNTPPAATGGVS